MPSITVPAGERSSPGDLRGRLYQALVGRRIDASSSTLLRWLNLAAFVGYLLVLLFYLLGAAMAAGTSTPGLELWLTRVLWTLALGAGACLYVAVLLAARDRWPWAVQFAAAAAALAFVLLHIFAPPGV
jgi:hypothetical protein